MTRTSIGISGVMGKMGRRILRIVDQKDDLELTRAIEYPGSEYLNMDLGEALETENRGVMILDSLESPCDVVIDFSSPEGTRHRAQECIQTSSALVVGTTGLTKKDRDRLHSASERIPVVVASNMSLGMNLIFRIVSEIAELLGEDYDVEIIEHHHREKIDAPSGTAMTLAEKIADARGLDPKEDLVFGRHGEVGARSTDEIGVHAVRGGGERGTHSVLFAGEEENIEIRHAALSRDVFARGAVRAAEFAAEAEPGLYNMQDVLNR